MITTAIQGTGRVNGGDTDVVPWFPLQGDQNWTPGIFQIADMVSKDHFYLMCTVCCISIVWVSAILVWIWDP